MGLLTGAQTIRVGKDLDIVQSHPIHFTAEEADATRLLASFLLGLKRDADGLSYLRQEISVWLTP